ncbi:LytS/YhcK type 5TM receptor domain-containing protein [Marivita sp. S2033]|uniref:LytS/YhcK type 5TM receptor domain-containing protein n=1 Tax=Marivita sp. S2033 TaxID=3373187 RepID=UPI0039828E52
MDNVFAAWMDLIAALGLIVALAFAYARLRRLSRFPRIGQLALGASFGLVAVLEMYHPIQPFDGMIVDLRNVPVALAGAFLGAPAACVTLAIGIAARAGIGGVGMWAGMAGMAIAMAAGLCWARWYRDVALRGIAAYLVLAVLMSAHLVAAFLLPGELAHWFFAKAAVPILAINLLVVPLLGSMLDAERRSYDTEQALRASVSVDPDTGLMPLRALERECSVRATALADGSFTQALVIELRQNNLISVWNTHLMQKRLVAAMRLRLTAMLPHCELACLYGFSALVLPLTHDELLDIDATKTIVRRSATEDPYALSGSDGHRISVDIHLVDLATRGDLSDALTRLLNATGKSRKTRHTRRFAKWVRKESQVSSVAQVPDPKVASLFTKADVLMQQRWGSPAG